MKIAWIGTGIMGKNMLNRLANHGHIIHAYNRTYQKMEDLVHTNILKFKTINDAIKEVDLIMTMVGFPQDVLDVYFDENHGILNFASPNQICIDFTTSSPQIAQRIYNNDKKIPTLDAPVTGGDLGAKNGTLSILVGGDHQIFKKVEGILGILGKKINYCGKAGDGQHAKLFNQILVAINIFATAEVLNYCSRNNINLDVAFKVFKNSIGNNWQLNNNGVKIINNDLSPGFYIKHFIKDLNLVKANEKTYLYALNEILRTYQEFVSEDDSINNLGTQSIYEFSVSEKEKE